MGIHFHSDDGFSPRCESGIVIKSTRPFQESGDCLRRYFGTPCNCYTCITPFAVERCCCNCFQLDFPGFSFTGSGIGCSDDPGSLVYLNNEPFVAILDDPVTTPEPYIVGKCKRIPPLGSSEWPICRWERRLVDIGITGLARLTKMNLGTVSLEITILSESLFGSTSGVKATYSSSEFACAEMTFVLESQVVYGSCASLSDIVWPGTLVLAASDCRACTGNCHYVAVDGTRPDDGSPIWQHDSSDCSESCGNCETVIDQAFYDDHGTPTEIGDELDVPCSSA